MSISVTIMSTSAMLGLPSETYRFGCQFILVAFSTGVGILLSSRIFLPVYFECNVSSIYEFLEMRFGKYTKYTVSGMFIIQMVLYTSTVLLGPALALNAVTDFSVNMMIILSGAVCAFYCFMGGIKAVLWTDAFQGFLMFLCLFVIYGVGLLEIGGFTEMYKRSSMGDRLQFFDFRFDFTTRFFLIIKCDPVLMKSEDGITKYDQLVPYFIISRLQSYPGLTGLCFAGIFSSSLSTISSALNSLATVTIIDFIQPIFSKRLNPKREVYLAKGLSLFYGVVCILLTYSIAGVDSIAQATGVLMSVTEGPVLAVFLIGVLTRKATDKGTVFGLITSVILISWICFGSLFSDYVYPTLPLETSGCPNMNITNVFVNSSITCFDEVDRTLDDVRKEPFILYKMPYAWIPTIGTLTAVITIFIGSLFSGLNKNAIPKNSKCLSPIVQYWMKRSEINGKLPDANEIELRCESATEVPEQNK
ncbi:sodium-coupled monocarboxylate transporter 1 [Trichonephila inaurata madagascariensis]|uniref:Sodium-coupled monocarboxylate transporter 1 n=1 Tax=Trichonephila inaurata madagascariensis TaxID=2747483 RepID=A0A8X6YA02_9ARAC|nr:sodium-coupled monocarboxylate transporter 1 [Trichonephila inaurata madagascariensis]